MSVQEILSYSMGIIKSLNLDSFISSGLVILLAGIALGALINVFRR